jgi:hypothetical protein
MIKMNEEVQEAMAKVGTLLEKSRGNQMNKRDQTNDSGERIKLYARRSPNRQKKHYYTDDATLESMNWCLKVIETVLGLKVSGSVLIRRCIIAYQAELIDLMMNGKGTDMSNFSQYLLDLEAERESLYECSNTNRKNTLVS